MCCCVSLSNAVLADDESVQTLAEKLKEVAPWWRELGVQLKWSPYVLDEFTFNSGMELAAKSFEKILLYWIGNGEEDTRTWGFLAMAVEKSSNRALARQIRHRNDYEEGSKGISIFSWNIFMAAFGG